MILQRNSILAGAAFALTLGLAGPGLAQTTITNVSYDPTRELYREYNAAFIEHWKKETGETVTVRQTHGGSGAQARTVIDGLDADVLTLAISVDISAVAERSGKLPLDWQSRLPFESSPYTSTIVFLVRKGNPKGIKDWDDLVKPGVEVITPNPKTSGGARWNYLAAWIYKLQTGGTPEQAQDFVSQIYKNVPVLDTGARGSTTTFVQRGIGDVLLAWENEAYLSIEELGPDKFDIIVPSISVRAEPPVTLVDANVDAKGTRKVAEAYLDYLYSEAGQRIAAKNFYRPSKPELADPQDIARFPDVQLTRVEDVWGTWANAQKIHFADGGIFDQIYKPGK